MIMGAHLRRALIVSGLFAILGTEPLTAQVIDIAVYGACNGGNAAGAVQNAINALPGSGGTLLVTCMADIGAQGITLRNRTNTIVRGVNNGGFRSVGRTTLAVDAGAPVMFLVDNCDNCTIESLQLNGNRVNNGALGLHKCDNTKVQNNNIFDIGTPTGVFEQEAPTAGLIAGGNRGNQYLNNTVTNTARWPNGNGIRGMWIGNNWAAALEHNPTITGNVIRNAGHTGLASHPVGGTIARNRFEDNGCAGAKVTPNAGGPAVIIEDNQVRRNVCGGLQFEQVRGGLIARRNVSEANGQGFVYSGEGVLDNVQILDNVSTGETNNNTTGAITLHGANNLVVSGNRFANQTQGMKLTGGATYNTARIACNTFENLRDRGVVAWNPSRVNDLTFTDNRFVNVPVSLLIQVPGSNPQSARNSYQNSGQPQGFPAGAGTPSCTGTPPPPAPPPPPGPPPPPAVPRIWGDVNRNGAVNSTDALVVLSHVVGFPTGSADMGLADVTADSKVSNADALTILYHTVGLNTGSSRVGQPAG